MNFKNKPFKLNHSFVAMLATKGIEHGMASGLKTVPSSMAL